MKTAMYFLCMTLLITLSFSCTTEDSVEEGLQYEEQVQMEYGEEETPYDNDRVR
jgi:hypothetical protein